MFREIDWLMNEHPDPAAIAAVAKMAGPHTQLVQCLVGWGDQHDAKKALENPGFRKLGIYGFAKPGENSLPLPIAEYRRRPVGAFTGQRQEHRRLAAVLPWATAGLHRPDEPKVNAKQSRFRPCQPPASGKS